VSDDEGVNPSTALATVIVDALAELGVRHVVLCPGSRSAPLAYALAEASQRGRIELHVRIDERSAGFLALGLGLGSRTAAGATPAAIVTTSGTAVANLHPAVLEAAHAGVPLLIISADRPHELRGTGASQTTDQVKLFGSAVRWFGELPAPVRAGGQVVGWRNTLARAVSAARGTAVGFGPAPGPVQLNVAFADPLTPGPGDGEPWPEPLTGGAGLTTVVAPGAATPTVLPLGRRTVVLAGDGAGPAAAELAAAAGWPLLAEPSSGVRDRATCLPYRLLLGTAALGPRIERVVVYGHPTLSRPVTRLLADPAVEVVVVSTRPDWADAGRRAGLVTPAVRPGPGSPSDPEPDGSWLEAWAAAGKIASAAIDQVLDQEAGEGRLTGPLIAREVAAATRSGEVLFAGSSNPVRDLDLAARLEPGTRLLANRGLAGIDGSVSTASGIALAGGSRQARALIGDLTFLHDAGGLLLGPAERRPDLQIVVVDDNGGGIFSGLEHGARAALGEFESAQFERVFGTPQLVDLAALCAAYQVMHRLVGDVETLRSALATPVPGLSVLQVRIDRTAHRDLSAELAAAVSQALADQLPQQGVADR
jgi:2-succinyl-5-enolpyruvyl-6-hydroxy-3-cyclohexene-1-carboxylate synthase